MTNTVNANNKYQDIETHKIGKVGEGIVYDILSNCKGITNVEDVSDYVEYQKQDVDFLVYWLGKDKQEKISKIEVKTEPKAAQTGNFFVEKESYYHNGYYRDGWFQSSQADIFFWYVKDTVYACSAKRLKEYIETYHPRTRICDDGYKQVVGYLVNIQDFCKKCNVVQRKVIRN